MAEDTCPHTPVGTAPSLLYLFSHELLPRTVREMKTRRRETALKLCPALMHVPKSKKWKGNVHEPRTRKKEPVFSPTILVLSTAKIQVTVDVATCADQLKCFGCTLLQEKPDCTHST